VQNHFVAACLPLRPLRYPEIQGLRSKLNNLPQTGLRVIMTPGAGCGTSFLATISTFFVPELNVLAYFPAHLVQARWEATVGAGENY
jgi:hypothetical protein